MRKKILKNKTLWKKCILTVPQWIKKKILKKISDWAAFKRPEDEIEEKVLGHNALWGKSETKLKIFWNFISLHSTYGKLIIIFFHSLFHLWKKFKFNYHFLPDFFRNANFTKKNSIKNCFHISTYFRFKINGEESVANCGYNKCDKTKPYGWNSQDVQNRNGFQCRFLLYFRIFVLNALHIIIIIFCENDVY